MHSPLHLPDILRNGRDLVAAQIQILQLAQLGDLLREVGQLVAAQIQLLEGGAADSAAGVDLLGEQRLGQRSVRQKIVLGDQCDQRQLADGIRQLGDGVGAQIEDLQVGKLLQESGQSHQPVVVQ